MPQFATADLGYNCCPSEIIYSAPFRSQKGLSLDNKLHDHPRGPGL